MMDTKTKIKLLRTAQNMTQVDLAKRAGIAERDISTIESGQVERWEQRLLEVLGYHVGMDDMLAELASGDLRGNGEEGASAPSTSSILSTVKAEAA